MTVARSSPRNAPWWRPRALRRQLVLGVSAVVTVAFVAVGVVSVLSLRNYVTATSDADLSESLNAFSHSYAKYRRTQNVTGPDDVSTIGQAMLGFSDQTPGNVLAVLHNGKVTGSAVFTVEDPYPAPADVVTAINAHQWHNGPPQTMDLGSLGPHRVETRVVDHDNLLFIGGSLNLANRTVASRMAAAAALYTFALLITAGLTITVVSYALRPLRRPPTTEYALARIESEAQRMASLVEELLLLSRLSEGQDLDVEDVDLADLVLDAVNDAAAAAPSHHWVKDLPETPVWVRGDRARLHQV
ncbi:histidine kinase, partial [Mycolicibacter kumamotonensis]